MLFLYYRIFMKSSIYYSYANKINRRDQIMIDFDWRKFRGLFWITLAVVVFFQLAIMLRAAYIAETSMVEEYVVRPGDTLWGVIEDRCASGDDIRMYVYMTSKHNNLNGHLHNGDKLELIVPKH